jgi:hypothetical protein
LQRPARRVRRIAWSGRPAAIAKGFEDQAGQPLQTTEVGPLVTLDLGDDESQAMITHAEDRESPAIERAASEEGAHTAGGHIVQGDEIMAGDLAATGCLRKRGRFVLASQRLDQTPASPVVSCQGSTARPVGHRLDLITQRRGGSGPLQRR